jgi:sigma-B regulation protein RsbU (phosphoserine phosphatase)
MSEFVMLGNISLARFFRAQALYLAVGAVGYAIFWAIAIPISVATFVLYSVCLGNLITPPIHWVRARYSSRPFPKNWLIFVAALLVLTPLAYVISSAVVIWIAPPAPQSLVHLVRTGWKFPCLLMGVYGVILLLYTDTKERLERRNAELQQSVDVSAAQLEMQEQELERAREIQQSLLPKEIPQIAGFEVAAAWQPAHAVGGDYFDVLRLGEHRLGVCIADVSGKGVSAALLMANVQATVRAFARESESPARVCERVNRVLCGNIATEKFVSFFYGILDAQQRTLDYCNAGHPCPIVVSGQSVRQLRADGAVLGVFPDWKYENASVVLASGDRMLLFTDGITEACRANGEEFGETSLAAAAQANYANSALDLNGKVLAQVTDFCAGRFQDDATLLVIAENSQAKVSGDESREVASLQA